MTFTPLCAALLALAAAVAPAAHAADHRIQPGLWENQVTVQTGDPSLDQLAADAQALWHDLTPEVREMVDELMASHGLSMGSVPSAPRVCITAEQAARDELPQQSEQCTPLQTQRNGNNVTVRFRCESALAASGEGEMTLLSPTRYRGTTRVDSLLSGRPQQLTVVLDGRWLAPDCRHGGLASR